MDFRNESALIDGSALSRFNAWTYCWRLAQDHPWTGGGFDAFTEALFDRYAPNPRDVHGPHSIYFGVLAEHGFPGLALYLTLALSTMVSLFQLGRRARYSGDQETHLYSVMLRFSILGFLIVGAFLGRAYFDYYFTLVACALILKGLVRSENSELEDADAYTEELIA
jgi:probable O-glycosylation ligase (exosortase A-associated)